MENKSNVTVSFVLGSLGGTIGGNAADGSWQVVSENEICPPPGYTCPENFKFHSAFGPNAPIGKIYEKSVSPVVEGFLDGYSGSVLNYGSRSSGKFDRLFGTERDEKGGDCIVLESVKDILKLSQNGENSFCFRLGYYLIRNHDKLIGKPNTTETINTSKSCKPEELLDTTAALLKEVQRQENKGNGLHCAIFWIRSFIVGTRGRPFRSLLTFAELPCIDLTDIRLTLEERLRELTVKSNNTDSSQHSLKDQLGDASNQAQGAGKDLKILKGTLRDVVKQELYMAFICNSVPSAVRETLAVVAFAKHASSLKINPVRSYLDPAAVSEVAKLEIEQLRSQLEKELEEKTVEAVLARDQLAVIEAADGSNETAVISAGENQSSVLLERPPLASRVTISFEKMVVEFEKMLEETKIWQEEEKVCTRLTSDIASLSRKSQQLEEDKKNLQENLAECKLAMASEQESLNDLRKSREQLQLRLSCERAQNGVLYRSNEQLQRELGAQLKFVRFVKNLGTEANRRENELHSALQSSAGSKMLTKSTPCGTNPERGFKRPLPPANESQVPSVSDDQSSRPLVIAVELPQPSDAGAAPAKKAKGSPQ